MVARARRRCAEVAVGIAPRRLGLMAAGAFLRQVLGAVRRHFEKEQADLYADPE